MTRSAPFTIAVLVAVAAVLLATLVVPVLVGVGKILIVVCIVLLLATASGLIGFGARKR